MSVRMRALIVDDEPIARRGVRQVLAEHPYVQIAGESQNGIEAVESIRAMEPELVFLDVEMPGLDGFGVIREIGVNKMPCVVFLTAFNQYALDAFTVAATDYVVKPYSPERLLDATARALVRIRERRVTDAHERLVNALGDISSTGQDGHDAYATRLLVTVGARSIVVPIDSVTLIEADGYYLKVRAEGGRYTVRESLKELELRLDPHVFVRVHRSAMVRISAVRELERQDHERVALVLLDGTRVPVSRARREAVVRSLHGIRG